MCPIFCQSAAASRRSNERGRNQSDSPACAVGRLACFLRKRSRVFRGLNSQNNDYECPCGRVACWSKICWSRKRPSRTTTMPTMPMRSPNDWSPPTRRIWFAYLLRRQGNVLRQGSTPRRRGSDRRADRPRIAKNRLTTTRRSRLHVEISGSKDNNRCSSFPGAERNKGRMSCPAHSAVFASSI